MQLFFRSLIVISLFLTLWNSALAQQVTAEELVSKHLDSIAANEKRTAIKNRFVLGEVKFKVQGSATVVVGKGMILSESSKVAWGMNFMSNDYPQDKFGFDGKKVKINRTSPEGRSFLTQFINDNQKILVDGVLGGALSNTWALLNGGGKAKLKVTGTKTINGRETIVLDYSPKGGSDVSTKLFFDSESFRHVRSEHTVARSAIQGSSIDSSAGQTGSLIRLVEEFSDFKKMGDLTLPSVYKITYSRSGAMNLTTSAGTAREAEWSFKFTDFGVNQELDANAFNIEN